MTCPCGDVLATDCPCGEERCLRCHPINQAEVMAGECVTRHNAEQAFMSKWSELYGGK